MVDPPRPLPTSFPPPAPNTRAELADAIWGLRDLAYDNPDPWDRIEAQVFFQALGELVQDEEDRSGRPDEATWQEFTIALRQAANHAAAWVEGRRPWTQTTIRRPSDTEL